MQHTVRQARKPAQSGLSGTLGRAAETLSFTKDAITYSAARGTTSAYAVSGGYAAARDTAVSAYDRAGSAGAGFYDSAVGKGSFGVRRLVCQSGNSSLLY